MRSACGSAAAAASGESTTRNDSLLAVPFFAITSNVIDTSFEAGL
jgi:hypothetical protein